MPIWQNAKGWSLGLSKILKVAGPCKSGDEKTNCPKQKPVPDLGLIEVNKNQTNQL